ncbi:hypothetical protein [Haloarcula sp. Atlit-7R]|uniref:hypothetical protein n=1 Tax=Haloarcula sp. Atlit-7R TaxID=2282125 RepID=UPI000EF15FD6|nr:hypothetical protein [Haloarcula sp. Atlit-7R]RLM89035.1 hypothetical protein D3D01_20285 [Haloarcula sp. Atlit-7R]
MDRTDWPTPGQNEPVPVWDEYRQLREAVHDYLDHEPEDPTWADIWKALGAIMGDYQRDAFVQAFDLDAPAETACIRRLITGDDECPHSPLDVDSDPKGPPHSPPADDHSTLWLDDGEPALYSMHVYPGNIERLDSTEPPHNLWFDVFEFAAEWGLEVSVLPKSWYNLGSAVHIVFYAPERYR